MEFKLDLSDIADEQVRERIIGPLKQFNEQQAGPGGYRPLVITVKNEADEVVGGLWGATSYGWLFTQLLVVPEAARGKGLGKKILAMAEREAIARGCHSAWLDTFEFQAKGFYQQLGYTVFGELPDYPRGFSRFFLKKSLV
ncbi:GNAT family N-acetyltransferase [Paludibacterium purpuratum]|uniref:Acetyltransferase (GNAT) family protein n=1 Tax=Paludibacterium purpuratum TaxID=1144873 RepID=A0A4R7AZ71_9NEIS|nr:GNAT family N-acetyltransferase [Paludibacterium purpuratum]TDR72022.1 acetyltransferase (GNAT) family protein [Paludibacterium purpuratum]